MADSGIRRIRRHKLADRLFHWTTAICTLLLLGTGFLPVLDVRFDWVTIHWIAGLVLTLAVLFHVIRAVTVNRLADMWPKLGEFTAAARSVTGGSETEYRPGKYSIPQVLFHFGAAVLILATIVTGLVMLKGIETPFWERDAFFVSEFVRGVLFVIHGFASLFLVTMIMLHIYFAFRPENARLLRSMILGWITREEYEAHHDSAKWRESDD